MDESHYFRTLTLILFSCPNVMTLTRVMTLYLGHYWHHKLEQNVVAFQVHLSLFGLILPYQCIFYCNCFTSSIFGSISLGKCWKIPWFSERLSNWLLTLESWVVTLDSDSHLKNVSNESGVKSHDSWFVHSLRVGSAETWAGHCAPISGSGMSNSKNATT